MGRPRLLDPDIHRAGGLVPPLVRRDARARLRAPRRLARMAGLIASHFRFEQRYRGRGLITLVISDYLACYCRRGETPRRLALLFLPRLASNPELHATALLRLAF